MLWCVLWLQFIFSSAVCLSVSVVFLLLSFRVVLTSCCSPKRLQSYYTLICSAYIQQLRSDLKQWFAVCSSCVQPRCSFTVWLVECLVSGWHGIVFSLPPVPLHISVVWDCDSHACLQSCWLILFASYIFFLSFLCCNFFHYYYYCYYCFSFGYSDWLPLNVFQCECMIPMFCVVLILFVYPFAGAGLWIVNTAGHGGGSIWHGLGCWPTAGLFQVPQTSTCDLCC